MMVIILLLETQSTIAARMTARLVKVDVDFRMTEMLVTAGAEDNTRL